MKKLVVSAIVAISVPLALAKLPAPDDAAKAKAAETAAKAAWQAKVDAYQLCKAQDKVAAKYGKHGGGTTAAKPAASGASAAASASTPVATSAPPPCSDPGPFAYNPPQQKPLETSEAHSPAGTAASPPSVKAESGQIQPSGKTSAKK
jgi:type II secretory pathway pseudopilin PulG